MRFLIAAGFRGGLPGHRRGLAAAMTAGLAELRRTWAGPIAREQAKASTPSRPRMPNDALRSARPRSTRAPGPRPSIWTTCSWRSIGRRARSASIQLYHRLRTAPSGDHLEEFEALVERLRADSAVRERAQLVALQIAGSSGLRRVVAGRGGFTRAAALVCPLPALSRRTTVLFAVVAPFWHLAIVPLVAMVAINMAVRYATDESGPPAIARGVSGSSPPFDRHRRIAALPRRRHTRVDHRSSSRRRAVAGPG